MGKTLEEMKTGLSLVGNTLNDFAQMVEEKNKIKAQSNRVKQIIKGDCETRDEAYRELGVFFYENLRENMSEENKELCDIIDKMNARIEKASLKFVELESAYNSVEMDKQNSDKLKAFMAEKGNQIKDQAKENAKVYGEKAKDAATDVYEKAKDAAVDVYEKAKDKAVDTYEKAKDKTIETFETIKAKSAETIEAVEDTVEESTTVNEDSIEDLIKLEEEKIKNIEQNAKVENKEETPGVFDF